MQVVKLSFNGNYFLSYIFINDQNKLPIKKPGFISVFCSKNIFRESGADNGGGWRQSRDLHHSSTEKTWNRKLPSDTKEKKLDIDGGDLGGKLRVRILPKTVQHQQGFVW